MTALTPVWLPSCSCRKHHVNPAGQMALGGPLGLLQRGASDVQSEVEVIAEDPPPQRWTSTSAELWPVHSLPYPLCQVFHTSDYTKAPTPPARLPGSHGQLLPASACGRAVASCECLWTIQWACLGP